MSALEKATISGGFRDVGVADTFTTGECPPRTKSVPASCASGFSLKNPSPYSSV